MEYPYKEYNQFVQDAKKSGYECKHSEGEDAPFIICETPKLHVVLGNFSMPCRYFCAGTVDDGYKIMPFKPAEKKIVLNPEDKQIENTF